MYLVLLLSAEKTSLFAYLFDEKCHPIRTLFGTILLLNLNICASLYSPIIVANYAVTYNRHLGVKKLKKCAQNNYLRVLLSVT